MKVIDEIHAVYLLILYLRSSTIVTAFFNSFRLTADRNFSKHLFIWLAVKLNGNLKTITPKWDVIG